MTSKDYGQPEIGINGDGAERFTIIGDSAMMSTRELDYRRRA